MTNTPPPVAALVEALEKISQEVQCSGFDCYYCLNEDQHPPTHPSYLASQAIANYKPEEWEAVRRLIKAVKTMKDRYNALPDIVEATYQALPQWAKDWALEQQETE